MLTTAVQRGRDLDGHRTEADVAVISLSKMGAEGADALRRLRDAGNESARWMLEHMAERGHRPQ